MQVPTLYGHKIVRALGTNGVDAAVIARVDKNWRAVQGSERRLDVDAIATGYGFLPNIELAVCCDCALRWDPFACAWFVAIDPAMKTTRPIIFAAGEITGIGGSTLALQEGTLAGIGAAEAIGAIGADLARQRRQEPATTARPTRHLCQYAQPFVCSARRPVGGPCGRHDCLPMRGSDRGGSAARQFGRAAPAPRR